MSSLGNLLRFSYVSVELDSVGPSFYLGSNSEKELDEGITMFHFYQYSYPKRNWG